MVERRSLPISIAEVHHRIDHIKDSVKRAGAHTFAGVYGPVLRYPQNYTDEEHRKSRELGLLAKRLVQEEVQTGRESFQLLEELDTQARTAGLLGVDLLLLPARFRNALVKRGQMPDLASISTSTAEQLKAIPNVGDKGIRQIREGLTEVRAMTPEQIAQRIAQLLEPKPIVIKERKPLILPQITEMVFNAAGCEVPDTVRLEDLRMGQPYRNEPIVYRSVTEAGIVRTTTIVSTGNYGRIETNVLRSWTELLESLPQIQRGLVEGALAWGAEEGFEIVGPIRRVSFEELRSKIGEGSAIFLYEAFGRVEHEGEPPKFVRLERKPVRTRSPLEIKARAIVIGGHLHILE